MQITAHSIQQSAVSIQPKLYRRGREGRKAARKSEFQSFAAFASVAVELLANCQMRVAICSGLPRFAALRPVL
jgi:hypothetical protein